MSKRGNGEGSIVQRGDGRWMARWTETADGTPKRRTAYAATRRDAAEKLRVALQRVADGEPSVEARDTFKAVAAQWEKTARVRQGLKANSLATYSSALRLHVVPVIGARAVRDVKASDVAEVLARMEAAGLSASYRDVVHKALSNVMQLAVDDGLIRANPVRKVKAPRPGRSSKPVPDRTQVQAMVKAAGDARTRVFVAILANTGLRISEALALRWSDVNGGTLIVRDGKGSKPRAVPVTKGLAAELKRWKRAQAAERLKAKYWQEGSEWIVTNGIGRPWDGRNARREFKVLADAHCPGASPHSMRHAAATIMLEEGVPMKVVSEVLGHSSIRVTADVYSHVTARLLTGAADAIDGALR